MSARASESEGQRITPASKPAWLTERLGVRVRTTAAPVGIEVDRLVVPALRNNPRRAQLWVSTVLGKHVGVDPRVIDGFGRLLGALVIRELGGRSGDPVPRAWTDAADEALSGRDPGALSAALPPAPTGGTGPVVVGYAETATALGHCVADALDARFVVHTTRRLVPGSTVSATFEESHSHASTHYVTAVPALTGTAGDTLVLVDDELSTGRTALATIRTLHAARQRDRYVIAALVDLRPASWRGVAADAARELGCRIDVVALATGEAVLEDDLPQRAAALIAALPPAGDPDPGDSLAAIRLVQAAWPGTVPDGGRFGLLPADRAAFGVGAAGPVTAIAEAVDAALPTGARRVLVVGTEEFMFLPLRLATALRRDADHVLGERQVRFQSTTRSPVQPIDEPGYPVRRRLIFGSAERGQDGPRFLYNASWSPAALALSSSGGSAGEIGPKTLHTVHSTESGEPDAVVVVADPAAAGPDASVGGLVRALTSAGLPVVVAVVGGAAGPQTLARARNVPSVKRPGLPDPLTGPAFGSYSADEVRWLLTDLSDADLERDVEHREARIQSGLAHYAESLPVEYQPGPEYRALFDEVLASSAPRLARAVGVVTELMLAERGHDVVLASLARAGTPIGILIRRWAEQFHGLDLPHYAVSIVRDRGIDPVALDYLAAHHDPASVVFVDGWTGKGAIVRELSDALREYAVRRGPVFDPDLVVLADPGHCVRSYGTRDDFLIASACLNSTVSGLVSRTVLNPAYLRPDQFHGGKFYRELADQDVSDRFLDAVAAAFPQVTREVAEAAVPNEDERRPTFAGWASAERIRERYGIDSVNFVKPGVGETTRVLLRRTPWRVLVKDPDDPAHRHIRLLAAERHVPVETVPDLAYACVGLIRRVNGEEQQ